MTQPTLPLEHPHPAALGARSQATGLDLSSLARLDSQIDSAVLGIETIYDMGELADRTGWTREELDQLWLWAGLPSPDSTQKLFNDSDVEGLAELRRFRDDENLDDSILAMLIRSIGTTVERLAVWQVDALTKHLSTTNGKNDTASRMDTATFAPQQTQLLLFLVQKLWMRHYAAAIHRLTTETILRRGVSADDQQFTLVAGVGFAKIVDYIATTNELEISEFAAFMEEFHGRVADIVNHGGGRIINNTGDFVLYVTARPESGAEIALRIADLPNKGFPAQIQGANIWTQVVSNYGDIYGPGVNLTWVLAGEAPACAVFTDQATAALLGHSGRFQLVDQPEIEIKGLGKIAPVQVLPPPLKF